MLKDVLNEKYSVLFKKIVANLVSYRQKKSW